MARYVYRPSEDGTIQAQAVTERIPLRGTPAEATKGFHAMVMDAYSHVENNGKWQGPWAKSQVKAIHETAMARDSYCK